MQTGRWEQLTSLAMLGLARNPTSATELPAVEASLPQGSREQTAIRTAIAALLSKLAGERVSVRDEAPPLCAPAGEEHFIPDRALRRLARMVTEGPHELVPEWCERASASSRVIPFAWIPAIFEAITPADRVAHARLFGARMVWLASLDAKWTIAGTEAGAREEEWATGTLSERAALLQQMRQTEPDVARRWLENTWATEPPEAREEFIELLSIGLSSGDEPFLESALDDKRKAVRLAAAASLSRLPHSAYQERMLARIGTSFSLEPRTGLMGRFSRRKLRVELPTALDKTAARDGIEQKPPSAQKIGERAYWLMQMLAVVPPAEWCRRFDCAPEELLAAAGETDYGDDICSALSAACAHHPDRTWVRALCAAWRSRSERQEMRVMAGEALARLIGALPESTRDAELQAQADELLRAKASDSAIDLLTRWAQNWSAATTSTALRALELHVKSEPQNPLARSTLQTWARHSDAMTARDVIPRMLDRLPAESPWRKALEGFHEIIEYRLEMYKELSE